VKTLCLYGGRRPNGSAIERFLYAGDAFILTSRYEGLSLSVLDGVACGLKLFLTRVLGNRCLQALGFQDVTWIESTEDTEAMVRNIEEALRPWLANPQPVSADQIRMAREYFDEQTQFEKVFQLYQQLVERHPPK